MQNDDQKRPDQPPIHTQLPDTIPAEDARKIVGDPVPQGADYNSPPPQGAGKSMGTGLDDVGGPGMGQAPGAGSDEHAATTRDRDSRADDQHMGNSTNASQQQGGQHGARQGEFGGAARNGASGQGGAQPSAFPGNAQSDGSVRSEGMLPAQGEQDGRYDVAEEVSLDQQSDQARRVGSMQQSSQGMQGDKLEDAVARTLGKDDDDDSTQEGNRQG